MIPRHSGNSSATERSPESSTRQTHLQFSASLDPPDNRTPHLVGRLYVQPFARRFVRLAGCEFREFVRSGGEPCQFEFDERHILTVSYVYKFPPSTRPGSQSHSGRLAVSGITTFNTGTPFSVTNGVFGDNAGVANGVGTNGSYADLVGNPNSAPPAGRRFCGDRYRTLAIQSSCLRAAARIDVWRLRTKFTEQP